MTSVVTALPAWGSSKLVTYGAPAVILVVAVIFIIWLWKMMNWAEGKLLQKAFEGAAK